MADVFLSHSGSDRPIAEALSAALQAAGFSTALEAADLPLAGDRRERLLTEVKEARLVLVLWSGPAAGSAWVQDELRLALEAWEADRLLLVRLDASPLPLGLRDVKHLDLPPDADAAGMARIVATVRARLKPLPVPSPASEAPAVPPPSPRWRGARVGPALALLVLATLGLAAWLLLALPPDLPPFRSSGMEPWIGSRERPRIEPSPGGPPPPFEPARPIPPREAEVRDEQQAVTYVAITLGGAAVAVLLIGSAAIWLRRRRSSLPAPIPAHARRANPAAPPAALLFVSYSRDDGPVVTGLIDALERSGLRTWLDTRYGGGGERFAGPIVEAIRASRACAFMCSSTAYDSDHVVRELYLADKYRKPMIPVELEPGTPAADFEYFFSGLDFVPATPTERCVQAILLRLAKVSDLPGHGLGGS